MGRKQNLTEAVSPHYPILCFSSTLLSTSAYNRPALMHPTHLTRHDRLYSLNIANKGSQPNLFRPTNRIVTSLHTLLNPCVHPPASSDTIVSSGVCDYARLDLTSI